MHSLKLREAPRPSRVEDVGGTGPKAPDKEGKDRKDRWDKAEIVLKPVGGLLTALAIAGLGFIGSSYLEKRQEKETNVRLYTELMNKREAAENVLRTDMFGKIFDAFLEPDGSRDSSSRDDLEKLGDDILSLELITRNFHEFLDIKPLFLHVLFDIVRRERALDQGDGTGDSASPSPANARAQRILGWQKERLFDIAGRVIDKQLEILEEAGDEVSLRVPLDAVCTDKSLREVGPHDVCPGHPGVQKTVSLILRSPRSGAAFTRKFTLYVERAYPKWRMVQVKVTAIEQERAQGRPDVDTKRFWIGRFDLPMVDNTYLSPDERYTVVIDDIDEESITVRLVYFPASFAGMREKSYYHQKVVQQLIDGSDLFRSVDDAGERGGSG